MGSITFGLMPAIIQFISTWYRRNLFSKIILDVTITTPIETLGVEEIKTISDRLLTDFYKLDFLFPSAPMLFPIQENNSNRTFG